MRALSAMLGNIDYYPIMPTYYKYVCSALTLATIEILPNAFYTYISRSLLVSNINLASQNQISCVVVDVVAAQYLL